MSSTFRSFAKLNLHLEVVGRRPDGFHELRTIFQTIDLGDTIELEATAERGAIELSVSGADLPVDGRNLAHRAARLYLEHFNPDVGVRIRIEKCIPVGGGLGGGSSNAATVLLGLGRVLGIDTPREWLERTARELGADVPFFLVGGTALGLGRGDEIEPLADPLEGESELWLALPPWSISTASVFGALAAPVASAPASEVVARAVARTPVARVEEWLGRNDLEAAAFRVQPAEAALYTALLRSGAGIVRMSGSGSAMFAQFEDGEAARAASESLPPGTLWQRVSTLGRARWRRASGFVAAPMEC